MRKLLYEHNTLNGFLFVLIEFIAVICAALFVGIAAFAHGRIPWAVASLGIAVNAATVCATVLQQMRRGEKSRGLAESFTRAGRVRIRREHPDLGRHTLQIAGASVVPFLLTVLTVIDRPSHTEQR